MIKIDKVIGDGIKDRKFEHVLGPVTVFIGDSFSGKTARLDAVRVALLGYHPKLGRRASDTMKLCRGPRLHVAVTMGERLMARTWQLQRGSAKYTGVEGAVVPTVLLDCREYFSMSGPERMAFVFKQIDLGKKFDDNTVFAKLRGLKPETSTPETERVITECVDKAKELAKARDEEGVSIQDWVYTLLEHFREQKKLADQAVKQMTGLQQGTAQLATGETALLPGANREREITEARDRFTKLAGDIRVIEEAVQRSQEYAARIHHLKNRRVVLNAGMVEWTKRKEEVEALEISIDAFVSTVPEIHGKVAELEAGIKQVERENTARAKDLEQLQNRRHNAEVAKRCPYCGANKPGWKAAALRDIMASAEEVQAKCDAGQKEITTLLKLLTETRVAYNVAAELDTQHAARRQKLRELQRQRGPDNELESERAAVERELQLLDENAPGKADESRLVELRTEQVKLRDYALPALEAEQRRWVAGKATEAQSLKARQRGLEQTARAEVLKLAVEAVRELQQGMIDSAITALMDVANKFTHGILKRQLQYRDGDIGYAEDGQWVTHECFSGTEEALAYAGLSVALAAEAELKLVMIDELGIVDPKTKRMIVERMANLVEDGVIAQFIGADVVAGDYQATFIQV